MGTPEFARVALASLCESKHEVLAVVTGRDQRTGRGRKLRPTVCRLEAERRGLPVLMPDSLRDEELYESLEALQADVFVVCAFRILPRCLFSLPAHGSVNIHASLLPRYRGAAPINWALVNGEKETGLTAFFLREAVDAGDAIVQQTVAIDENDTYDTLSARLSELAGPFLLKTLDMIESGNFTPQPQDESQASRAPKIGPVDAMIDFGFPARNVRNFVRGMATKPGAYTFFRGKKLKVHACAARDASSSPEARPGTILTVDRHLVVQCDRSAVELLRIVPEGGKEMDGLAFVNGYRPRPGEILGEIPHGVKE